MEKMVSYKVTVRCKDSVVLGVEHRSEKGSTEVNILIPFCLLLIWFVSTKGVVEVTYSSGRVTISSNEEQAVIRQSGTGRLALLEEEEEEGMEWRRVDGRLKKVPSSSTSSTSSRGEKVIFWLFWVF